jgi:serine/threonine-protein kinase
MTRPDEPRAPTVAVDADERDARLAALLAALSEDLRAGRPADVERVARDHPDLTDELHALWSAALVAEDVARSFEVEPEAETEVDSGLAQTAAWASGRPEGRVAPPALAGETIGGFELIEEVGRGGMGVVYRALQREILREVAVKRLLRGASATPDDLARFRAEVRAAARLTHPNIVAVHEVGSHDGQPYLVMPFVEGTTLAKRLADGPLPALDAARLLAPVARAIQHAHEHGVLHRDLKPSNILIDADGRPLVSDFGLAKRVDAGESLTQSGALLGTPSYMAPEQAAAGRGPAGPSADVYGLGAVLYQMLTGRPPFQAATPLDTLLLVLEQDPVPPRLLNPTANADLEMVALKCLQKDPRLRYPSAAALADDLERFLHGEPVSARSASLRALVGRVLGETHLAPLEQNWGPLWMLHSVALLVFFGLTNWLSLRGVTERWPYVLIFTVGLGAWAAVFWSLRRRGGPITFAERLLAHVWGMGVISINLTFLVEWLLGLPVLTLAPMLAVTNGGLFLVKGGILSGAFYVQAAAVFLAIVPMAWYPRFAPIIFASVAATCFFVTGLRAHLKRVRARRIEERPVQ